MWSKAILIVAAVMLAAPLADAIESVARISVRVRQIQFFDECDDGNADCEPKVVIAGVGSDNCDDEGKPLIADCGATFTFNIPATGGTFTIGLFERDGCCNNDDHLDISSDDDFNDKDVTVSVNTATLKWSDEGDMDDCDDIPMQVGNVNENSFCILGRDTPGDHDEASVEIKVKRE